MARTRTRIGKSKTGTVLIVDKKRIRLSPEYINKTTTTPKKSEAL
jgi:hypothetical protein